MNLNKKYFVSLEKQSHSHESQYPYEVVAFSLQNVIHSNINPHHRVLKACSLSGGTTVAFPKPKLHI
jgi:hypothetical protein